MKRLLSKATLSLLFIILGLSAAFAQNSSGKGPAYVIGSQDQLFYLGSQIDFSTQSAGTNFFTISPASNAAFGNYPGYANTTSLGFSASTPNATATAVSCQDSFWDINFQIAGTGAVAGDVIAVYLQKPDGTGRITLASFTVQPDNQSVRVTSVAPGVDLAAIGHTPTALGAIIPFEEAAGSAGKKTSLITLALPMNGTFPDCAQLVVSVARGTGTGTTTVGLVNLVVTRMGNVQSGTSVQGTTGTYATGLKCEKICPATLACDKVICFRTPYEWCYDLKFHANRYDNLLVEHPFINFSIPFPVYEGADMNGRKCRYNDDELDLRVSRLLGCDIFYRPSDASGVLSSYYIAAQLSLKTQVHFYNIEVQRQKLGCHIMAPMAMMGMPAKPLAIPATLSNGTVINANTSFFDFFDATDWALRNGTLTDREKLIEIYKQLTNCRVD